MSLCSSRRVQSPPLQCTETLSTRKCFRCLWVFFVGNFGLKILGQGCITAQHFTLQYLGARTWGSSSILWVVWIVISNVCGSPPWVSGNLGRLELCRHESRCRHTASSQPAFAYFAHKQSLPTLRTNNHRYDHRRAKHWKTRHSIQTDYSRTFRKKLLDNCLKMEI